VIVIWYIYSKTYSTASKCSNDKAIPSRFQVVSLTSIATK